MPPLSYIITAVVLAAGVAVSIPPTLGFSILLWYWLFAAAGCILVVAGAFKVAAGLSAPLWIGIALASPALVWAAFTGVHEMTSYGYSPAISLTFGLATRFAHLAAAAGALKLVETLSGPHAAFRIGYWVLAAAALLVGISFLTYAMGLNFTKYALYATTAWAVTIAATLVKYGAVIGAAVLITMRRDIERWTAVVISLIGAYMLYKALWPLFPVPGQPEGLMFWLWPVVMFVGGAAVWRMGSVLRGQVLPEPVVQG